MERLAAIARELSAQTQSRCAPRPQLLGAGGGGSRCYRWPCGSGGLFVKVTAAATGAMLEAEAAGLSALAHAGALRVPRVCASGHTAADAFLALEWLDACAPTPLAERRLGEGLAALHAVSAPRCGWQRDNTIGRTPQLNGWMDDWGEFFRERRLRPQLALAAHSGFAALLEEPGERLLEALPRFFAGYRPVASLLHGDLWGGNWLTLAGDEPVIFDPAVYYGDRETDLAMTRLFGGFGESFYAAYAAALPPAPGARARGALYNLYHLLNHANLFGAAYARAARASIDGLLVQLSA
jgi:protein-ribulosamine 3-kinase